MFGLLRRLIMSGDIKGLLDGSRRALRELSPALGETGNRTGPEGAIDFLSRQGVDPAYNAPYRELQGGVREFGGPGGRRVQIGPDGRRYVPAPEMYSPIVSPYEGGRVWPMFKNELGNKFPAADRIPPWAGRGPSPMAYYYNPYDDGFAGSMPSFMPESLAYGYGEGVFDASVPWAFRRPVPPMEPQALDQTGPGVFRDPQTGELYDQGGYPLPGTFADEYSGLRNEAADWRRRGLIN